MCHILVDSVNGTKSHLFGVWIQAKRCWQSVSEKWKWIWKKTIQKYSKVIKNKIIVIKSNEIFKSWKLLSRNGDEGEKRVKDGNELSGQADSSIPHKENRGAASLGEKFRFGHVRIHSYPRNTSKVHLKLQTDRSGHKVLNRLSAS